MYVVMSVFESYVCVDFGKHVLIPLTPIFDTFAQLIKASETKFTQQSDTTISSFKILVGIVCFFKSLI